MNVTPPEEVVPLTPQAFHILMALAERPLYGYGIVQQCQIDASQTVLEFECSRYREAVALCTHRLTELTKPNEARRP